MTDRCHRLGQTMPVQTVRFIIEVSQTPLTGSTSLTIVDRNRSRRTCSKSKSARLISPSTFLPRPSSSHVINHSSTQHELDSDVDQGGVEVEEAGGSQGSDELVCRYGIQLYRCNTMLLAVHSVVVVVVCFRYEEGISGFGAVVLLPSTSSPRSRRVPWDTIMTTGYTLMISRWTTLVLLACILVASPTSASPFQLPFAVPPPPLAPELASSVSAFQPLLPPAIPLAVRSPCELRDPSSRFGREN